MKGYLSFRKGSGYSCSMFDYDYFTRDSNSKAQAGKLFTPPQSQQGQKVIVILTHFAMSQHYHFGNSFAIFTETYSQTHFFGIKYLVPCF